MVCEARSALGDNLYSAKSGSWCGLFSWSRDMVFAVKVASQGVAITNSSLICVIISSASSAAPEADLGQSVDPTLFYSPTSALQSLIHDKRPCINEDDSPLGCGLSKAVS